MKQVLDLPCAEYGCGYLHDLEYKRTEVFPKGTGISTLRRSLTMQYLYPSPIETENKGPFPIVVFVSGGAWRSPQVHFRIPFLVPLALRGFLVAMPEYRGCELFSCEDAVSDVRSAVRYIRKHAAEYNGDPDNIFLMGESAGAHLSMLAAYGGNQFDDPADDLSISAEISGVLELYGPTNCSGEVSREPFVILSDEALQKHPYAILARGYMPSQYAQRLEPLSPLHYVQPGVKLPPTLLAHGEEDKLVPIEHAETIYVALAEQNIPVEYYRLNHAGHGNWRFFDSVMMDTYAAFIKTHTK